MWPDLPIEFTVKGSPVSFQSQNSRAKVEWKSLVRDAALDAIGRDRWAFMDDRLAVTLYYFPEDLMPGDVDNIVKLTIDALVPNIYVDDALVDRVVVQRFDPASEFNFQDPSERLVEAMESVGPVLYIRIDEVPLKDLVQ